MTGSSLIRTIRAGQVLRQYQTRSLTSSVTRLGYGKPGEIGKDDKHVLGKQDENNVQSYESQQGQKLKQQDQGGHATQEKDVKGGAAKAKSEFPEAPDTAIGMQDERGGKGH